MKKQRNSVALGFIITIVLILNGVISFFIRETPIWIICFIGAICLTLYTFEQYKKFVKLKANQNNKFK